MLSRILPERMDNAYRGHPAALWLLLPIAFMKLAISLVHVFRADGGARAGAGFR